MLMTSCLNSSDNETTVYADTAITAMTLGTLNRYTKSTSSTTGNDTIIKSTLTGSGYMMTIDQLTSEIYNQDWLPSGTDLKHVVVSSVTAKNNGIVTIKSLTSDSIAFVSSSDSIDFSSPRTFRVYSSDLTNNRDYTVTLFCDPYEGVTFSWQKVSTNDELQGWTNKRLVEFEDTVYLADENTVSLVFEAYRLNGQNIEKTENMKTWTTVSSCNLKQLLGFGTNSFYGLSNDGKMMRSDDNCQNWQEEPTDEDASMLPVRDMALLSWDYAPLDSTDYVLLVGTDKDDKMCFWREIYEHAKATKGGQWVHMPVDDNNRYTLPQQEGLSLVYYKGDILALGSNGIIYQTRDQGITWRASSNYALPSNVTGSRMSMCTDINGNLWVMTNTGELWQGTKR